MQQQHIDIRFSTKAPPPGAMSGLAESLRQFLFEAVDFGDSDALIDIADDFSDATYLEVTKAVRDGDIARAREILFEVAMASACSLA